MALEGRTQRYRQNGTWVERALPASAQGPLAREAYFFVDRWVGWGGWRRRMGAGEGINLEWEGITACHPIATAPVSPPGCSLHPNDPGHQTLAELLVQPLVRAVREVEAGEALGEDDVRHASELVAADLPPPMIPGNVDEEPGFCALLASSRPPGSAAGRLRYAGMVGARWHLLVPPLASLSWVHSCARPSRALACLPALPSPHRRFEGSIGLSRRATAPCLWQEDFKGVVVEQQGFEFRPERPNASEFRNQKWGWTSSRPGEEGGPCAGVTRHAHGGARSSPRRGTRA